MEDSRKPRGHSRGTTCDTLSEKEEEEIDVMSETSCMQQLRNFEFGKREWIKSNAIDKKG